MKKNRYLLLKNLDENVKLERVVASFLIKFNKELFWDNIQQFNVINLIDLLWYLDFDDVKWEKVNEYILLENIYTAKGYINKSKSSDNFELNVLIALKNSPTQTTLDLNFEFICDKCKKTHPIYESRCPHCEETLSFIVEPKLGRGMLSLSSLV